ncbi:MAG: hypothetical protein R2827_14485 [Bdellovibrionales bacterium]
MGHWRIRRFNLKPLDSQKTNKNMAIIEGINSVLDEVLVDSDLADLSLQVWLALM